MSASNLALEALKEFVAHFGEQHSGDFAEIGCVLCEVVAKGSAAIAALEAETGEAVDCQFQGTDGRWRSFDNDQHKENTIASGKWPIRNLYTSTPPAVPPGWKLVPIEPTPEMWKAGLANLFKDVDGVWKAMLEKAPKP